MSVSKKNSSIIGYTAGVYDLFHIGHLNLLKNSKALCDKLIVGVSTDECVYEMKKKKPIVPYVERIEIIEAIPHVDVVTAQTSDTHQDKFKAWEKYKFDVIFVGDDWHGTEKWNKLEEKFKAVGVKVIYFPYTRTTSSTKINKILDSYIDDDQTKTASKDKGIQCQTIKL